jgi:sodium transport system permease protein
MARSTKEGQYYLMPLLLICMPLMILAVLPTMELSLGTSLIPITGVMLLLRRLMEGEFQQALLYLLPVIGVTLGCCLLAVRWAIDQFNNESVLFRENERLDLVGGLVHLIRHRPDTPTVAMAIACGLVILLLRFFVGMGLPVPDSWTGIAVLALVSLVGLIAVPAVTMALMLTRRPARTLLLRPAPPRSVLAAVALAACLHPLNMTLAQWVHHLYPIQEGSLGHLKRLLGEAPNLPLVLLIVALTPAVCEELAFRGFILSGLRHTGHKWRAILLSSLLFGIAHGMLQQSLMATASGVILGYLAVQTGSLLPCVAFHFVHNSLSLMVARFAALSGEDRPALQWLLQSVGDFQIYWWPVLLVSIGLAWLLLRWFRRLTYEPTPEEQFQQSLDRDRATTAAVPADADEPAAPRDTTAPQRIATGSGLD